MAVLNVLSLPGSVQLPFRRSAAQARWLPNTDALRQESLRVLPLLAWGVNMGVRKPDHPQPLTQQLVRTERVGFEPKVRLSVQRFSSSKTFVLARVVR
jgi:hypothetical protein